MSGAVEWRPIPGFERYEVSQDGRIRSPRGELKQIRSGYYYLVTLYAPGVKQNMAIHRAVALAFVDGRSDEKPWALHRNGDSIDNRAENLYWGDPADNSADMVKHGRAGLGNSRKTSCHKGHPFDKVNTYIIKDGRRDCRKCIADRLLKSKMKKEGQR